MENRTCPRCDRPLTGRADQRYCSARCRVAANREANRSEPPKRPRRPLWESLREGQLVVMRGMGRILDTTRDDRYRRNRAEMEPQIRNSLLLVLRESARSLRELAGDDAPEPTAEDGKAYPPRKAKDREKALMNQVIGVKQAGQLRNTLIMTQGSEGPIDDMSELVTEIDHAIVGLVDAREWITRNR